MHFSSSALTALTFHQILGVIAFWFVSGEPCVAEAESLRFYIRSYRIEGVRHLSRLEVEQAAYPFMGPGRSPEDVESARSAIEKAYHDKGFQTVSVTLPQQDPRQGTVRMHVTEGTIGRVRVNHANWFLPSRIRRETPSLAEGSTPNFKKIEKDLIAVNRLADRKVTPELRQGREPGTFDVDLNVEDQMPLHGSLELNNRYSADTSTLRLNGALSYANLFQLGHTIGLNVQIAPENTDDGLVYSGFYLARVADKTSLLFQATRQESDISTLGGAAVAGTGVTLGVRALIDLPISDKFYQSLNFGIDYKKFDEDLNIGGETIPAPIEYYPLSLNHSASWMSAKGFTELNHTVTLQLRGMGSDQNDYDNKRYDASASFIHLRSDVAHTHDLDNGARLYAKVQGQVASGPVINNEQFAGGGLGTVRGYLEATALGDYGVASTIEARTPTLIGGASNNTPGRSPEDEWRFHAFLDAAMLGIHEALPGQSSSERLASFGVGSRIRWNNHFNGSVDAAMPLIEQPNADEGDVRFTFRSWADF